jgi:hypothetical protein
LSLRNSPISLESDIGRAFVSDCARNLEKLIDTEQLCERYGLSIEDWQRLGLNKALELAIQTELKRRIRNGVAVQEAAAKEFTTTPIARDDISLSSLLKNHEFITDCARYAEGLYSEQDVKKKHHFDNETWAILGNNDEIIEAIEAEKVRRASP